jgi:hypothetical protein
MKRLIVPVLAAALAAASAASASAQLSLESVHWQVGRSVGGRVASWQDVSALPAAPKAGERLRARLVLKNDGPRMEEGLLLRYGLSARLLADSGGAAEGAWAVPFDVDEKRVPKVGAGKAIEVALDAGPALDLRLRRMALEGWRPDRVKISVMLEPRRGEKTLQLVEDVLSIGPEDGKP